MSNLKFNLKSRIKSQNEYETKIMDDFISELYKKPIKEINSFLKTYTQNQNEGVLILRDTTGNFLIHHICTIFQDSDHQEFQKILDFLFMSSKKQPDNIIEQQIIMNSFKAFQTSEISNQEALLEMGFNPNEKQILSIIIDQTPLHLLTSTKKYRLLEIFLDTIYEGKYEQSLDFNINALDSAQRSFLHCLLDQNQVEVFEQIVQKFNNHLDLSIQDKQKNQITTMYKQLKVKNLDKFLQSSKYSKFLKSLLNIDLIIFPEFVEDYLFHNALKTNFLTSEIKSGSDWILQFLQEIDKISESEKYKDSIIVNKINIYDIVNSQAQDGYSLVFKIMKTKNFAFISDFLKILRLTRINIEEQTQQGFNILHCLFGNRKLKLEEKLQIMRQFIQKDQNLLNQIDNCGNSPLNIMFDNIGLKEIDQNILNDLNEILQLVDFTKCTDSQIINKNNQLIQKDIQNVAQLRKDFRKSKNRNKKIRKTSKFSKKYRQKLYGSFKQFQKDLLDQQQIQLSPLFICVKKQQIQLIKMLIQQQFLNVDVIDFENQSIVELAFRTYNWELIKLIIDKINIQQSQQANDYFIRSLKIWGDALIDYEQHQDKFDFSKFKQLYLEFINKINSQLLSIDNISENKYKKVFFNKFSTNISEFIMSHQNSLSLDIIIVIAAITQNIIILDKLKEKINKLDQSIQNQYLYRIIKYFAKYNDQNLIQDIIKVFPNILQMIKNDNLIFGKVIKSMTQTYFDIKDPTCISIFRQTYNIMLPSINLKEYSQNDFNKKIKRSINFLKSASKQILQQKLFQNLMEEVLYSVEKGQKINLPNLVLFQLSTTSQKDYYLQKIIEKGILFKVIDIRKEGQREIVKNTVRKSLLIGEINETLKIFKQLRQYLDEECSEYPVNYYAEIQQFQKNFPYRQFKFDKFIRRINHKKDIFPIYFGQKDEGVIDDDTEDKMNDLWNQLIESHESQQNPQKNDVYVPNGCALLFCLFYNKRTMQTTLNQNNIQQIQELIRCIYDFGGFPQISINNLNQIKNTFSKEQFEPIQLSVKLLTNLNACILSQNYQSALHQLSLTTQFNKDLLQFLCSDKSYQKQSFNSRDSKGRTPIMLAIEHKNFEFLKIAFSQNSQIFIQDNEELLSLLNKVFQNSDSKQQMELLILIRKNVDMNSKQNIQLLEQQSKQNLNEVLDLLYQASLMSSIKSGQDKYIDEISKLQVNISLQISQAFTVYHNQILGTFKILRQQILDKNEKQQMNQTFINYFSISKALHFGQRIVMLAVDSSVEEIQQFEKYGYNICNLVCPAFKNCSKLSSKFNLLPEFYPFKQANLYHYSYALKYAIINQEKNEKLINYIFSQMDLIKLKPFLLEIMIYVGKYYGTKNQIFQKLFKEEKAYLMGRILTVESVLKKFEDSQAPVFITQFYNIETYNIMLGDLAEILIQNNEPDMFKQFIQDQSHFYLCTDLLTCGFQACVRNFRPRMALILASISFIDTINVYDYANFIPDPDQKVTVKQVEETSMIMRSLKKKFTKELFLKCVRTNIKFAIKQIQISREMIDEFINYIIDHNLVQWTVQFNDKEKKQQNLQILSILSMKSSPLTFKKLLPSLKCIHTSLVISILILAICQSEKEVFRMIKSLIKSQNRIAESVTNKCFSKNYKSYRRAEMKNYLLNKIGMITNEKLYVEMLFEEGKTDYWCEVLCITEQDLKEIKDQVQLKLKQQQTIDDREFVFSEMQNLIGVFKTNNQHGQYQKIQQSSIKDLDGMSLEEIKQLTRDQLKTKSENLILLYEQLMRDDKRRAQVEQGKVLQYNNRKNKCISDQELAEIIYTSQPSSINISSLFSDKDTMITDNAFENEIINQKFKMIQSFINLDEFNVKQLKELIDSTKYQESSWNPTFGLAAEVIQFVCKAGYVMLEKIFEERRNFQNAVDQLENFASGYHFTRGQRYMLEVIKTPGRYNIKSQLNFFKNDLMEMPIIRILQEPNMDQELFQQFFNELSGQILMNPECYQFVFKDFYQKLFQDEQFIEFINSDKSHVTQKDAFFSLLYPAFYYDNQEIIYKTLQLEHFIQNIDEYLKKSTFVSIASKNGSDNKIEQLLIALIPYLQNIDLQNFQIFIANNNILKFSSKTLPKIVPVFMKIDFDLNSISLFDLISYLIKCKRFNVVKQFIEINSEAFRFESSQLLYLLQSCQNDKEILEWGINKVDLDIDTYPKLYTWLHKYCSPLVIEMVTKKYGKALLDKEIEIMQNLPEERKFENLIADLIIAKQQKIIYKIKEEATPDQWNMLKSQRKIMSQNDQAQGADDSDNEEEQKQLDPELILPFYLALMNQDFILCRILLPSKEQIITMTQKEKEILLNFINDMSILNFQRQNNQNDLILSEFQKIAINNQYTKNDIADFKITKKLVLFPEMLYFILNNEQIQDEFRLKIIDKIKIEFGQILEVDLFLLECGLIFDNTKLLNQQKYEEQLVLYFFQNSIVQNGFFADKNYNENLKEIIITPYSYFKNHNLLNESVQLNMQVFQSHEIKSVQSSLHDLIKEKQNQYVKVLFANLNNSLLDKYVFNFNNFALSYYLLLVFQQLKNDQQILVSNLNSQQQNMEFDNFAKDLVFQDKLVEIVSDKEKIFQILVGDKKSKYAFFQNDDAKNKPILRVGKPKQMAHLIYLLNSYPLLQIFARHPYKNPATYISEDSIERHEELTEITLIDVIKQYFYYNAKRIKIFNLKKLKKKFKKEHQNEQKIQIFARLVENCQIVKQGIEILNKTLYVEKDYQNLCHILKANENAQCINNNYLSDHDFTQVLVDLSSFKNFIYKEQFMFNLHFSDNYFDEIEQFLTINIINKSEMYQRTQKFCNFITIDLNNLIQKLTDILDEQIYLEIDINQNNQLHFSHKLNHITISASYSDIFIEEKQNTLIQLIQQAYNQQKLQQFMSISQEQLKKQFSLTEVEILDPIFYESMSQQDLINSVQIIQTHLSYQKNYNLSDLILNKLQELIQYKIDKKIKLQLKGIKIQYQSYELLIQDRNKNYITYYEKARNCNISEEDILLQFAFDFDRKQIIINDAAFLPFILFRNIELENSFIEQKKFYDIQSQFQTQPTLNANTLSLYNNVISLMKIQDPELIAKQFLLNNTILSQLLSECLQNMIDQYTKQIKRPKKFEQEGLYYNMLDRIIIQFDIENKDQEVQNKDDNNYYKGILNSEIQNQIQVSNVCYHTKPKEEMQQELEKYEKFEKMVCKHDEITKHQLLTKQNQKKKHIEAYSLIGFVTILLRINQQ